MSLSLKPNHASDKAYYETLHEHGQVHFDHECAVRRAFGDLLATSGRLTKPPLTLVTEYPIDRVRIRIDGALISPDNLVHGLWEAKDEDDDPPAKYGAPRPKSEDLLMNPTLFLLTALVTSRQPVPGGI